jgi:hypothetical protein
MLCTPKPNGFADIIPFLNGYFIGKINPTFSDKPISPAESYRLCFSVDSRLSAMISDSTSSTAEVKVVSKTRRRRAPASTLDSVSFRQEFLMEFLFDFIK